MWSLCNANPSRQVFACSEYTHKRIQPWRSYSQTVGFRAFHYILVESEFLAWVHVFLVDSLKRSLRKVIFQSPVDDTFRWKISGKRDAHHHSTCNNVCRKLSDLSEARTTWILPVLPSAVAYFRVNTFLYSPKNIPAHQSNFFVLEDVSPGLLLALSAHDMQYRKPRPCTGVWKLHRHWHHARVTVTKFFFQSQITFPIPKFYRIAFHVGLRSTPASLFITGFRW